MLKNALSLNSSYLKNPTQCSCFGVDFLGYYLHLYPLSQLSSLSKHSLSFSQEVEQCLQWNFQSYCFCSSLTSWISLLDVQLLFLHSTPSFFFLQLVRLQSYSGTIVIFSNKKSCNFPVAVSAFQSKLSSTVCFWMLAKIFQFSSRAGFA